MTATWTVPGHDEDPSEELIEWLHDLPIDWDGDPGGINFTNPDGVEVLVLPGQTFTWDGERITVN